MRMGEGLHYIFRRFVEQLPSSRKNLGSSDVEHFPTSVLQKSEEDESLKRTQRTRHTNDTLQKNLKLLKKEKELSPDVTSHA